MNDHFFKDIHEVSLLKIKPPKKRTIATVIACYIGLGLLSSAVSIAFFGFAVWVVCMVLKQFGVL